MCKEEQKYQVSKQDLTVELKAAIAEFFVGVCEQEGEDLVLSLVNGQKFRIQVEEITE